MRPNETAREYKSKQKESEMTSTSHNTAITEPPNCFYMKSKKAAKEKIYQGKRKMRKELVKANRRRKFILRPRNFIVWKILFLFFSFVGDLKLGTEKYHHHEISAICFSIDSVPSSESASIRLYPEKKWC